MKPLGRLSYFYTLPISKERAWGLKRLFFLIIYASHVVLRDQQVCVLCLFTDVGALRPISFCAFYNLVLLFPWAFCKPLEGPKTFLSRGGRPPEPPWRPNSRRFPEWTSPIMGRPPERRSAGKPWTGEDVGKRGEIVEALKRRKEKQGYRGYREAIFRWWWDLLVKTGWELVLWKEQVREDFGDFCDHEWEEWGVNAVTLWAKN